MIRRRMIGQAGALVALGLLASPVAAQVAPQGRVIEGPRQPLGEGSAASWVALDAAGTPISVGVTLTDAALRGLPAGDTEVVLELPAEARRAGFDHVGLNWAPHGHEPPGVFDKPHFDMHFYAVTQAERDRMVPSDPAWAVRLAAAPPAAQMPEGFISPPGGIPRMGAHWLAAGSPELRGQPFERIFILGTYDARLVFLEPMIALSFLESRQDVTLPIPAPARPPQDFAWPSAYAVTYDPGQAVHRVALMGLMPPAPAIGTR